MKWYNVTKEGVSMKWYNIYNESTGLFIGQLLATSCADAEAEAVDLYPEYRKDGMYAICNDEF